jgi:uncharacterized membrane protein HdeD (DUF308 family)
MTTPHDPTVHFAGQPHGAFDRARLHARIARHWWAMALRGAAAVLLALLMVAWPGSALYIVVLIFAGYCLVDGVLALILAVRRAEQGLRWVWPAFTAMVAIAVAIIALGYPALTMIAFAILLAVWAMLTGVVTIVAGARLPGDHGRWWMIAGGAALLLLGLVLALAPPLGLVTLVWIAATGVAASGFAMLGLALRLRRRHRDNALHARPPVG